MRSRRAGPIAAVLAVALATIGVAAGASAAGNTLRIEPASTSVARDATFTVRVVQNAAVATSGAQATVTFDPTLLQITAVTRGAPYASAPIFLPADVPAAIAAANQGGSLDQVAAALLPPASVPAGDADFLVVELKAIGCGQADLGLPVGPADASLIDGAEASYGDPLEVTTTGGTVTTCAATASAGSTPPVTGSSGTTDGGTPLLPIALAVVAVVAIAAAGLWWTRRPRPS